MARQRRSITDIICENCKYLPPYWHQWCIRCERSPVGNFPLPETKEDVWHDSDEVSPT
ncbi:protein NinD [Salmonella enterica]|uniref:protein NinD n=1 Tax=Salmonella enterica TaxID=28901 RepID=UPI0010F869EE|nr:protein NinD [Salmonella enterica]